MHCCLELFQKTHVVLKEQLQIVDVVLQHRITLDTAAERETCVFLGIIVHEPVEIGMHHAAPHHLNPSRSFANAATCAAAENTRHVYLSPGFDERKEARAEPRFRCLPEETLVETL